MIQIDLTKAKAIAHDMRRSKRAAAFAPLDAVISLQIPGANSTAAEAARQAIRDADAVLQSAIDVAVAADEIKTLLGL